MISRLVLGFLYGWFIIHDGVHFYTGKSTSVILGKNLRNMTILSKKINILDHRGEFVKPLYVMKINVIRKMEF